MLGSQLRKGELKSHIGDACGFALAVQDDKGFDRFFIAVCHFVLYPRAKDSVKGPIYEENLALIQTVFGEHSRAISTLAQLLQTPYDGCVTPAH